VCGVSKWKHTRSTRLVARLVLLVRPVVGASLVGSHLAVRALGHLEPHLPALRGVYAQVRLQDAVLGERHHVAVVVVPKRVVQ
jgi:hypothetical protein